MAQFLHDCLMTVGMVNTEFISEMHIYWVELTEINELLGITAAEMAIKCLQMFLSFKM